MRGWKRKIDGATHRYPLLRRAENAAPAYGAAVSRSAGPAGLLLAAENVTVRRGRVSLVSQLDLTLNAGELVHVRGPNGAGKTSVLRVLCGLSKPAEGVVRRSAATAFVPENVAFAPHMSGHEWLDAMRRLRALDPIAWATHAVVSGLEATALHKPSRALSKGMAQRIALIEALAFAVNRLRDGRSSCAPGREPVW
jgi:ABC-type multidrug transport system ATPase subunit